MLVASRKKPMKRWGVSFITILISLFRPFNNEYRICSCKNLFLNYIIYWHISLSYETITMTIYKV